MPDLPVAENRIVGRRTGEDLDDLTPAQVLEMLAPTEIHAEASIVTGTLPILGGKIAAYEALEGTGGPNYIYAGPAVVRAAGSDGVVSFDHRHNTTTFGAGDDVDGLYLYGGETIIGGKDYVISGAVGVASTLSGGRVHNDGGSATVDDVATHAQGGGIDASGGQATNTANGKQANGASFGVQGGRVASGTARGGTAGLTNGAADDVNGDLLMTLVRQGATGGNFIITGLPTSDPGVPGALWNSSGTVKISL